MHGPARGPRDKSPRAPGQVPEGTRGRGRGGPVSRFVAVLAAVARDFASVVVHSDWCFRVGRLSSMYAPGGLSAAPRGSCRRPVRPRARGIAKPQCRQPSTNLSYKLPGPPDPGSSPSKRFSGKRATRPASAGARRARGPRAPISQPMGCEKNRSVRVHTVQKRVRFSQPKTPQGPNFTTHGL